MTRMPALFVGHGSPMNTLDDNPTTRAWRELGAELPRPRAILCVSAHWYINATAVTAMERPRTIHDFFGFPQELFDVQYPAPGDLGLAHQVIDVVAPHWVGLDIDSWGLDHGCWSVLAHMFPAADVPVVQLSVHAALDLEQHVQIGRSLAALADDGVLVVASGNVVHHLGKLDGSMGDRPFDWAERFDDAAGRVMTTDPASITSLAEHPDVADAVPTSDHFLPLAYLAGLADARGTTAQVWNRSFALGSLSMTSYRVD